MQGEYHRVRGSPRVRNPVAPLKVTTGTQISRLFSFYFLILTQTALGVSQITGGGVSWLIQGLLIPLLKQYQYEIKRSNRKVETMVKDDTVQAEGRTYPCRKVTREDCRKDADRSRASRSLSLVYYRRRISVRVRRVPYPAMPQSAQVVTYKT